MFPSLLVSPHNLLKAFHRTQLNLQQKRPLRLQQEHLSCCYLQVVFVFVCVFVVVVVDPVVHEGASALDEDKGMLQGEGGIEGVHDDPVGAACCTSVPASSAGTVDDDLCWEPRQLTGASVDALEV